MPFEQTLADLQDAAKQQRAQAKGFLVNILDLASTQASVIVPQAASDIVDLARSFIPRNDTVLAIFDKLVGGAEVDVAAELTRDVQVFIAHGVDRLNALLPDDDTPVAPSADKSNASDVANDDAAAGQKVGSSNPGNGANSGVPVIENPSNQFADQGETKLISAGTETSNPNVQYTGLNPQATQNPGEVIDPNPAAVISKTIEVGTSTDTTSNSTATEGDNGTASADANANVHHD